MKKFRNTAIACCLLGFIIASCGKNENDQLARTWQVSDIETTVKLPDSVKTKMLNNSVMVFTKDGHYNTNGGIGVDQGTYTLDKDGKNLSTISEAGKDNSVYVIEKLSDEKLILNNNGSTVTCTAKK
jgi:hypothetical protein